MIQLKQVGISGEALPKTLTAAGWCILLSSSRRLQHKKCKADFGLGGVFGQVTLLERRKIHCALILWFAPLLSAAFQVSGPQGLVRVIATVPVWGKFTITDCPGCNAIRYFLSLEGGASGWVFAKNAQLTELPVGPFQWFKWWSTLESGVSQWLKLFFNNSLALSAISVDWN